MLAQSRHPPDDESRAFFGPRLGQTAGSARLLRSPAVPPGPSGVLASLTDTIEGHRARAEQALAGSGLSAHDEARIRSDIRFCAESERRLRGLAAAGNDAACVEVLSAFTAEGINSVLPRLTRVRPATRVAVNEAPDGELATMPYGGPDLSRPSEREAERIAALLAPAMAIDRRVSRRVLARYLDSNAVRAAAEAVRPAVPGLVAGAGAGAAAVATAPLWVWVVVAVVVVVALVAVAYWVFSDDTEAVTRPQPQPAPQPAPAPAPAPPVGLTQAERELWDECTGLHDQYKATQDEYARQAGRYNELRDRLENSRANAQERLDFCNLLDVLIGILQRLHQQRLRYITRGCDQFDWFGQGTTRAQREAAHNGELDNVGRQIDDMFRLKARFCR